VLLSDVVERALEAKGEDVLPWTCEISNNMLE
jgi:hypothetical protein